MRRPTPRDSRDFARRLGQPLIWIALWLVLVDGDPSSAGLAAGLIAAAALTFHALRGDTRARMTVGGAVRFLPFFLRISIAGGFDVALRAFRRRMRLAPRFLSLRLRLPETSPATTFFVAVISLVPGTLCAEVDGSDLTIHVVDHEQPNISRLRALEERIAVLFGETIEPGEERV